MAAFSQFVTIDTPDGPMPTYIAVPEGQGPSPAVLVIEGQGGVSSFELSVAERLARHGYVAAVPDLFHRGPGIFSRDDQQARRRTMSDPRVISDVNALTTHLKAQPFVRGDRMGIMGFCMGGRVSYLMATANPELRAAASFYGGGILKGEDRAAPIDLTGNIRCPVMLLDGLEDSHPSPDEVRGIAAVLEQHGIPHEVHLYPGADHGYMNAQGARRREEAIEDSWKQVLSWFERYLVAEPALVRS